MLDAPAADPRALLANDRERWILKRLLGYAYKKTQNVARARDIAQEAIALMLEARGWHAWVYEPGAAAHTPEKSLLKHLCNIARATAKDENKSARERREIPFDPVRDARVGDPSPGFVEATVDEAEFRAWEHRAELVVERLDARARAMLQLEQQDIHDAAEQAARLACTVQDIYRARERIAHHADVVLAKHGNPSHKEGT